ncbi:MAG: hypothetical protein V1778_00420 [bacterium]
MDLTKNEALLIANAERAGENTFCNHLLYGRSWKNKLTYYILLVLLFIGLNIFIEYLNRVLHFEDFDSGPFGIMAIALVVLLNEHQGNTFRLLRKLSARLKELEKT